MSDLKYTQEFAKDFIDDMGEYFRKTANLKNFIIFNNELNNNLDFGYLVKKMRKNKFSFEFDKENNRWNVTKLSQKDSFSLLS